jgi:glutamate synthase domain-containing protein 3
MVGSTEVLSFADLSSHWKARHLDLAAILHRPSVGPGVAVRRIEKQDHGLERSLDNLLVRLCRPALERGERVEIDLPIKNTHRCVGTTLSGRIALKHGHEGLPDETIRIKFTGSAGQSFGCFLARGVTLLLEGDANDYLGKGLSGGRIAVFPPREATFRAEDNIIAGNVIAYGAIAGELYLRGVVGERFCVRNSGVNAVVEGVGDHGCEYMTGGRVVVIGRTGRNFAAGMSGGIAYVYDPHGELPARCNAEMVSLEAPDATGDEDTIRSLLERHIAYTASPVAQAMLDDWASARRSFVKVMPNDYRRVLANQAQMEERARALAQRQAAS